MKILLSLTLLAVAAVLSEAQTKPTSAADYNGTFTYAVAETNAAFPFVFTVVTEKYEGGKLVSTETQVSERQAEGVERETTTLKIGRKTLRSYSIMVGFDNGTYCSTNGIKWTGPQEYICPNPEGIMIISVARARQPETAEYTVTEKSVGGQSVKVYRKYAVYAAYEPGGKKTFEEEIATIDSRGFFISVTRTEGTLNPKITTQHRTQTWDHKTKFRPVLAPK